MASSDEPRGGPPAAVEDADPGVSRRAFLKSVGVTGVVAGVVAEAAPAAQAPAPAAVGPGEVSVALTVNGTKRTLKVEPRVTLLDALRNRLDITGLKRVCDRGTCGACTAVVDGRTAYTCSMLAIEAQGKDIRTIEGLSDGTVLHPVQQAILEHDGTMCGFCTPGFVMSAVAFLQAHPTPTAEQAREALDGNICRCGTYNRLLDALLQVKGGSRG
jgi:xanthine dehydrogenase YagT iron-sulfur-binding subunit